LSWRDVLKDSKQVSHTVGSLNWDDEEVPEEDDNDCLKELKRLFYKAKNHPNASNVSVTAEYQKQTTGRKHVYPKSHTCEILEELKELKYSEADPTSSYSSHIKIIGEGKDRVAVYRTFSPRGFFFTVDEQYTGGSSLVIVLTEGYGEENDFR